MKKILVVLLSVLLLASCSQTKNDFAHDYVQGTLDSVLKGTVSKAYIEIVDTDQEKARQDYLNFIESEIDYFAKSFELVLTDNTRPKVREIVEKLYKNTKYIVGPGLDDKNGGFRVDVKIIPVETIPAQIDKHADDFNAKYEHDKETGVYDAFATDAEREDYYTTQVLTIFDDAWDDIAYGKEVTVTIKVTKDSSDLYFIADEDISLMMGHFVKY